MGTSQFLNIIFGSELSALQHNFYLALYFKASVYLLSILSLHSKNCLIFLLSLPAPFQSVCSCEDELSLSALQRIHTHTQYAGICKNSYKWLAWLSLHSTESSHLKSRTTRHCMHVYVFLWIVQDAIKAQMIRSLLDPDTKSFQHKCTPIQA